MAEEIPTLEQTRKLNRDLTEKVLDRATSDPQWRQQLLEDSEAAMREANFPEAERLREMHEKAKPGPSAEVVGQHGGGGGGYCPWYCYNYTHYWDRPYWSYYGEEHGGSSW